MTQRFRSLDTITKKWELENVFFIDPRKALMIEVFKDYKNTVMDKTFQFKVRFKN